ncbi:hypothetical protein B0H15DRAFT_952594 [Mycena belliarum]|uniref:Uncharacterized protein n=1 Tax=Mycena belliarum TaxID=1033014 RepID=A0AAD6U237_9AGAR|nr:hypothetical protein B0H15DRAFT_974418 [Mycena belliae]KAJ7082210.1 hypothetical protein B0H15DRAFT_952594 [Mycena belliae]
MPGPGAVSAHSILSICTSREHARANAKSSSSPENIGARGGRRRGHAVRYVGMEIEVGAWTQVRKEQAVEAARQFASVGRTIRDQAAAQAPERDSASDSGSSASASSSRCALPPRRPLPVGAPSHRLARIRTSARGARGAMRRPAARGGARARSGGCSTPSRRSSRGPAPIADSIPAGFASLILAAQAILAVTAAARAVSTSAPPRCSSRPRLPRPFLRPSLLLSIGSASAPGRDVTTEHCTPPRPAPVHCLPKRKLSRARGPTRRQPRTHGFDALDALLPLSEAPSSRVSVVIHLAPGRRVLAPGSRLVLWFRNRAMHAAPAQTRCIVRCRDSCATPICEDGRQGWAADGRGGESLRAMQAAPTRTRCIAVARAGGTDPKRLHARWQRVRGDRPALRVVRGGLARTHAMFGFQECLSSGGQQSVEQAADLVQHHTLDEPSDSGAYAGSCMRASAESRRRELDRSAIAGGGREGARDARLCLVVRPAHLYIHLVILADDFPPGQSRRYTDNDAQLGARLRAGVGAGGAAGVAFAFRDPDERGRNVAGVLPGVVSPTSPLSPVHALAMGLGFRGSMSGNAQIGMNGISGVQGQAQYPREYSIFMGDLAPETSNSHLVAVWQEGLEAEPQISGGIIDNYHHLETLLDSALATLTLIHGTTTTHATAQPFSSHLLEVLRILNHHILLPSTPLSPPHHTLHDTLHVCVGRSADRITDQIRECHATTTIVTVTVPIPIADAAPYHEL